MASATASSLVSIKLNKDNYLHWRGQIQTLMRSQGLMKYVDGSLLAPSQYIEAANRIEENPAYESWHRSDQLALSWIMVTVSEQVLGQILHVETAHEAWVELERSYGTHTPLRIMMLKKELNFIKKDGGDMVSYLDHVKSLVNTLVAAGHPVSTPDLIQITLNGLPKEYESLVTYITTSATIEKLTFNGLYDLLLNQEQRIQILKSKRVRRIGSRPEPKPVALKSLTRGLFSLAFPLFSLVHHWCSRVCAEKKKTVVVPAAGSDDGGWDGGAGVHRARLDDLELKDLKLEAFWNNCERATDPGQQAERMATLTSYWGGFGLCCIVPARLSWVFEMSMPDKNFLAWLWGVDKGRARGKKIPQDSIVEKEMNLYFKQTLKPPNENTDILKNLSKRLSHAPLKMKVEEGETQC
ncbi:Retrovirus-related Pol polyprotein from transposon TNT 1-94 [Nymphaea thermarum]|nr:Retrovirus-related Pol polyprotein from transposon TNT 1-94 [Nymphaea thermarum]